ncbi:MAG TPA: hypothetical protein VG675_10385 [Bryobacteraceae bacterium]|nr:hypothetical protein [Bryobacteraceae bacterium]
MTVMKWVSCIVPILEFVGRVHGQAIVQIQVQPQIVGQSIRDGHVTTVFLAPRYVTAIRMPEPINSVVVGDPSSFSAEHSDREPNLVFVKPITPKVAQTNLLISSTRGLQTSLLLVSRGELKAEGQPTVGFLMRYKPAGQFLIQPADSPSAAIPQTVTVGDTPRVPFGAALPGPVAPASLTNYGVSKEQSATQLRVAANSTPVVRTALDDLLDRQRLAPLPALYGQRPGISPPGKELVKTGVSEVIDQGSAVVVLFAAVNVQDHAVELMPPQIQLGGMKKAGMIIRKSRWSTSEQLPVTDFRMSRRRLGPGERADGVVVFQRPSFKQSTETLFLQMAESGAVDRPALAPIGFGISSFREVTYGAR